MTPYFASNLTPNPARLRSPADSAQPCPTKRPLNRPANTSPATERLVFQAMPCLRQSVRPKNGTLYGAITKNNTRPSLLRPPLPIPLTGFQSFTPRAQYFMARRAARWAELRPDCPPDLFQITTITATTKATSCTAASILSSILFDVQDSTDGRLSPLYFPHSG